MWVPKYAWKRGVEKINGSGELDKEEEAARYRPNLRTAPDNGGEFCHLESQKGET